MYSCVSGCIMSPVTGRDREGEREQRRERSPCARPRHRFPTHTYHPTPLYPEYFGDGTPTRVAQHFPSVLLPKMGTGIQRTRNGTGRRGEVVPLAATIGPPPAHESPGFPWVSPAAYPTPPLPATTSHLSPAPCAPPPPGTTTANTNTNTNNTSTSHHLLLRATS